MGLIYKLTFSNGKIYIGMTTKTLKQRLRCHRSNAKAACPKMVVSRAWKAHGEPTVEVLSTLPDDELSAAEIEAIRKFGSFGPNGYNSTPGGETSPTKTPEVAAKIRALALTPERIARNIEIHLGSKRSIETRAEISRSLKGLLTGIPKSAEHRRKISEANRGKYHLQPGRTHTEDAKKKMSESAKRSWDDPARRENARQTALAREAKKRLQK